MSLSTRVNDKIKQRDFKLNALLEITAAINANLPVKDLLKQYEKVLRGQLSVDKLILFTKEEKWKCILKYGVADDEIQDVSDERFLPTTERNHFYHRKNPGVI